MADRFVIGDDDGLEIAKRVIRKHAKDPLANVYSFSTQPNGALVFSIGQDARPDKEYGRYKGAILCIVCIQPDRHADAVEHAIREALGFSTEVV